MSRVAGVIAGALTVGCLSGPPDSADPLESEAGVVEWATRASTFGAVVPVSGPIGAVTGDSVYVDPTCPLTTDDGTTFTVAGDCNDQSGTAWAGSARVVRAQDGVLQATYDGFGNLATRAEVVTGTVEVHQLDDEHATVDMQVVWKSEESSTEVVYSADLRMDVPRWASANGAGTFTRTGGLAAGVIEAETTDQLLDGDICANAALSGSTTLVSSRHTAVITYDGLTDCDPDQAAPWSMDGADRGVIEHIGCSAGGRTGGGLASAFVLLLAAALVSRPRRC